MPSLPLLFALLLPPTWLGVGALLALGIGPRADRIAWLGWAWTAGSLLLGALLFAWLALDVPPGRPALLAAVFALGLPLYALAVRRRRHAIAAEATETAEDERDSPFESAPPLERWLFRAALAFALVAAVGWLAAATRRPVFEGDEAGVWNVRAKVVWAAGDLGQDFREAMERDVRFPVHKDYPLLNPLLQVWSFAMAGRIVHTEVRLPVQLLHVALVLALAGALARRVRPAVAAALLLAYLGLPRVFEAFVETKADHMVALGLLVAADGALRFRASGERRWWSLAAIGAALLVLSKHEGMLHFAALAAALALTARGLRPGRRQGPWAWSALPVLALAGTWLFDARFGFSNTVARGGWTGGPSFLETLASRWSERLAPVLEFYGERVLASLPETHGLFLVLALLALARIAPRVGKPGASVGSSRARELPTAALATAFALAGLALIYLGTTYPLAWHLETSGVRTACQVLPLALLGSAAGLADLHPAWAVRARGAPL